MLFRSETTQSKSRSVSTSAEIPGSTSINGRRVGQRQNGSTLQRVHQPHKNALAKEATGFMCLARTLHRHMKIFRDSRCDSKPLDRCQILSPLAHTHTGVSDGRNFLAHDAASFCLTFFFSLLLLGENFKAATPLG